MVAKAKADIANSRYKIKAHIDSGGMADIFLATDKDHENRFVIIKVIKFSGTSRQIEKDKKRFKNEINAYKKVKSPYIAELYDYEMDTKVPYIVMEYVEGSTIKDIIRRKNSISPENIKKWTIEMTKGFQAIHDANIIHRDIKNQNIMVNKAGHIKIIDFGIALTDGTERVTEDNSVIGSPDYLPPEATYLGATPTHKYDIYSLGILIYEMATGMKPFSRPGASAPEIVKMHSESEMTPIYKIKPKLPRSISNIVARATAKSPRKRYSSMKSLAADMSTALSRSRLKEKTVNYNSSDDDSNNSSWLLDNKLLISIISGVVLLIIIIVVVSVLLFK